MTRSGKTLLVVVSLLAVMLLGAFAPAAAQEQTGFTLSAQPSRQVISSGMSSAYAITVTSIGGFQSPVQLKYSGNLPSSVSATYFSSDTVTPAAGGSGFTLLVIHSTFSTPAGEYTITISGSGAGYTVTANVVLDVTCRSTFIVAVSPISQTIGTAHQKQYQIMVTSLGRFSGEVDLSAMPQPSGISYTITPSRIYLSAGSAEIALLDVAVAKGTDAGTYVLIVRGTTSAHFGDWNYWPDGCHYWDYWTGNCFPITDGIHYSFAVVQVPATTDYHITVTPQEQSAIINHDIFFTIAVNTVGGFASEISLGLNQVPTGVAFSFEPDTLKPTDTSPASSTLTIKASTSARAGEYSVDVTATVWGVTRILPIDLTIIPLTTGLTVNVPYDAVKRGDPFTITGIITPAISGAPINLLYTRPDGTMFTRVIPASSDGTFSDQYSPDTVDLIGTWHVRAEYYGTPAYTPTRSQTYEFKVIEKTFLEQYGLLWAADSALWLALLALAIILIVLALIVWKDHVDKTKTLTPPPPASAAATPLPTILLPPPPNILCGRCGRLLSGRDRFCDICGNPQIA